MLVLFCFAARAATGGAGEPAPGPSPPLDALYAVAGEGADVALFGDRALIGMPSEDGGRAFLYRYDAADVSWALETVLEAPPGTAAFGQAVALSERRAVVGAPDGMGGMAFVYAKVGASSQWRLEARLAPPGEQGEQFGWALDIDGARILVGDHGAEAGAAYVFTHAGPGNAWQLEGALQSPSESEYDHFGVSVALSGERALVGAFGADGFAGAAYLYTYDAAGQVWGPPQLLQAPGRKSGDYFGVSVALSGERALVGALGPAALAGAAYAFAHDEQDDRWAFEHKLEPPPLTPLTQFGAAVTLSGDRALVGAYGARTDGPNGGAAFVFGRDEALARWVFEEALEAPEALPGEDFGWSVALGGGRAIVAARRPRGDAGDEPVFSALATPCAEAALAFASFSSADPDGEHVALLHGGSAPAMLGGCSLATVDVYTGRVIYSTTFERAAMLPAGTPYLMANAGYGDGSGHLLPPESVPSGPGILVLWSGPAPPAGTMFWDITAPPVAWVIYGAGGDILTQVPPPQAGRLAQPATADAGDLREAFAALHGELVDAAAAAALPDALTLDALWPNPAQGPFTLRFGLPESGPVRVVVYDALGREVAGLLDAHAEAGWHTARLEHPLASGVYVLRLVAGDAVRTRRLTIVR